MNNQIHLFLKHLAIGGHCAIIGGVKIGDNSIIAAGAVVTRDVPENTIFAGNPAKKLKDLPIEK